MRLAWLSGLVLVALAVAPARSEDWSRRYPLKGRAELHAKTDDGSIRIETGAANEIDARVTTEGWRIAPGEVTITESQTGDRVDIEVRLPKMRFGLGWRNRSVSVVLRVPRQTDLDVRTGDGSIDADGLQGEIRLRTGDGSVRATGLAGRLTAESGDGSVTVRGRFDALTLGTGDGGIDATAEAGSKIETAWSLHSGDGSITLRLPEGLAADLDAHTGDGSISIDTPVRVSGTIREHTVRGKLGAGGLPLRVHTGDGSIRLTGL